jgi:hypothetical protein
MRLVVVDRGSEHCESLTMLQMNAIKCDMPLVVLDSEIKVNTCPLKAHENGFGTAFYFS